MTPPTPAKSTVKTLPWVLLGLLSVFSLLGPFLILITVRGGERQGWPPDRPIEWWVFGIVTGMVVVLMAACVTIGVWLRRKLRF